MNKKECKVLKILYITNNDDKYGGAQCLMELMEYIRKYDNVEVVLLNPKRNGFNSWCTDRGIENYSIEYCDQMYCKHNIGVVFAMKYLVHMFRYFVINPTSVKKIERTLDIQSFDIIHSNTSTLDIGMMLAKRNGIKHVWHLREFGKEDMHFIPFRRKCYKRMNNDGGYFIAISDVVMNAWEKKGINRSKILKLYDGVKANCITSNDNLFDGKQIKIAFCGSITCFKDQEQLIRAFCLLSDSERDKFKVDFWGNGDIKYIKHLKNLIIINHLEHIFSFKGYSNNMYNELMHYDIGINCSHSEAFGRVTVEYMLAGLLTVASDTGANVELIQQGKTGIVFKKNEDIDLANQLRWILNNKDRCVIIARQGTVYAKQHFSIEDNVKSFYDFYSELLDK